MIDSRSVNSIASNAAKELEKPTINILDYLPQLYRATYLLTLSCSGSSGFFIPHLGVAQLVFQGPNSV